jgi:hypothetical protein
MLVLKIPTEVLEKQSFIGNDISDFNNAAISERKKFFDHSSLIIIDGSEYLVDNSWIVAISK